MASKFSVEAIFSAKDKMTAPVTKMQNRIGKMSRSMQRSMKKVNNITGKVSAGFKKFAVAGVASLTALGAGLANVIMVGANFENTMVSASAKFGGGIRKGSKEFEALAEAAKKTGETTEFSASQSAEALNFLAMAGFSAKNAIKALPGVVNLATSSQIGLAEATDIASDALGAFNMMTKDSAQLGKNLARINDVLAKTATSANTDIPTLFETIKKGAPVATAAGASLETYAALAGTLANAGIKGSDAGTALKNTFLSLSAPTAGASKVLKKLGVQTVDAQGNMIDVVKVIGKLNKSMIGMGTAERSANISKIFGKIPLASVNVLLQSGEKNLEAFRRQLELSAGSSEKMANTMRDTVIGKWRSFNSAIEAVKISIFDMNKGPLADIIDKMTEWVRANKKLISSKVGNFLKYLLDNYKEIGKTIAKIGKAIITVYALITALKIFTGVMTAVNIVMAMNPVGLIVLGITALIAAVVAVIYWWDEIKESIKATPKWVDYAVVALGLLTGPIGLLGALAFMLIKHWDPISKFFKELLADIVSYFTSAYDTVMGIVDKIANAVKKIRSAIGKAGESMGVKVDGGSISMTGDFIPDTPKPQTVSPQERTTRMIEEKKETQKVEITIQDNSGKAQVTSGTATILNNSLQTANSGAF